MPVAAATDRAGARCGEWRDPFYPSWRCRPRVGACRRWESFGLGADPHSPTRTAHPPEGPTKAALCDEAVASVGSLADPEPLSGAARDLLLTSAGRAVPPDQKHIVG